MTREDLEEVANRWQLARHEVNALPTACDVQQIEHDLCGGWDDFTSWLSLLRTASLYLDHQ